MKRKLLGIIDLDFDAKGQLLIICFAFVRNLRNIGIKRSSSAGLYSEKINKNEMCWTCSADRGDERPIRGFGGET
jgi:hypothetical protein